MVNKIIILGNLGKDPEFKDVGGGICNFSVATKDVWTDKAGAKQEKAQWHNVVVFGNQAVNCKKYLAKGSKVYVEGRLDYRSYEKDGVKKYVTDIKALNVQFLSEKKQEAPQQPDTTIKATDDIPW